MLVPAFTSSSHFAPAPVKKKTLEPRSPRRLEHLVAQTCPVHQSYVAMTFRSSRSVSEPDLINGEPFRASVARSEEEAHILIIRFDEDHALLRFDW